MVGREERAEAPAEDADFRAGRADRGRAREETGRKRRRRPQPSSAGGAGETPAWAAAGGPRPRRRAFGAQCLRGRRPHRIPAVGTEGRGVTPEDPQNIGCCHEIYLVCYCLSLMSCTTIANLSKMSADCVEKL